MSLHLITSISGAPGVSTAALGMSLLWPGPSMLIEADAQQHVLAGFWQGNMAAEPNLANVSLTASRLYGGAAGEVGESIWRVARRFPKDGQPHHRLFVPGPMTPWARTAIDQQWPAMAPALVDLGEQTGLDVVVDLGRLARPASPTPVLIPAALFDQASVLAVMVEPTLASLAAARVMLQGLQQQAREAARGPQLGLVLREPVSPSRRFGQDSAHLLTYSAREITRQYRVPVFGEVVHDTAGAVRLNQGQDWDKSRLAKSITALAQTFQRLGQEQRIEDLGEDG